MTGPDPTNKVTETVALDSCGVTAMVRESWFDGFGRTVSIVSDDGGGAITQATEYDGLGRVVRAHLPRRTAEADFWTESGYDGLGRVVTALSGCTGVIPCVVSGAVTTTQTSYSGLRTTVTDPAGKTRTTQMDGLGRLSQVEEPKSPTAAPVGTTIYTTTYGYNLQDLLTSVAQDTVTRGFSYDSAGRLLSATNPESGTTSYGYDNNGNLTSRTDGRGVVTTTSYDSLNRTTGRSYTGAATPAVTSGLEMSRFSAKYARYSASASSFAQSK